MSLAARICTLCALRCGDFAANFSSNSVLKFERFLKFTSKNAANLMKPYLFAPLKRA